MVMAGAGLTPELEIRRPRTANARPDSSQGAKRCNLPEKKPKFVTVKTSNFGFRDYISAFDQDLTQSQVSVYRQAARATGKADTREAAAHGDHACVTGANVSPPDPTGTDR